MELGQLGGLIGGLVGTYVCISNAKGPKERTFAVKYAVCAWVFVFGFVVASYLLPNPWRGLVWIFYLPLLLWGIAKMNREQTRIRSEEGIR